MIITKENERIITSVPIGVLQCHNSGVGFLNPFTGLECLAFLLKYNDLRNVYIFKE